METLVANITGKVRRETLDGRRYLVAPVVLMQGGSVMNGSKGALYYPPEECAREPGMWNNVPITDGHPVENGYPVSARSPEVLAKYKLGYIFNDRWDGSKRTAEAWYDEELTRNKSPKTYDALEANRPFDLSTGLMTDNVLAANGSQAKGKAYSHIARNYRPDHVASLVGQTGACSLRDGCGVLVGNEEESMETVTNEDKKSLWRQLGEMLGVTTPIENAFCPTGEGGGIDNSCSSIKNPNSSGQGHSDDHLSNPHHNVLIEQGFTYSHSTPITKMDGTKYLHHTYKLGERNVGIDSDGKWSSSKSSASGRRLTGRSTEDLKKHLKSVKKRTNNEEGETMTTKKDELVTHLTTNCDCWKGQEKVLTNLDEATLTRLKEHEDAATQNALTINALREIPELKDVALNELPAAFAKKAAPAASDEKCPECGGVMSKDHVCKKEVMNRLKPASERLTPEEIETLEIAREVTQNSKSQLLDLVVNANASNDAAKKAIRPLYEKLSYKELKTLADNLPKGRPTTNDDHGDLLLNFFTGASGGGHHTTNRGSEPDPNDVLEPFYTPAKS